MCDPLIHTLSLALSLSCVCISLVLPSVCKMSPDTTTTTDTKDTADTGTDRATHTQPLSPPQVCLAGATVGQPSVSPDLRTEAARYFSLEFIYSLLFLHVSFLRAHTTFYTFFIVVINRLLLHLSFHARSVSDLSSKLFRLSLHAHQVYVFHFS